jgi:hypothetical protein
MRDSAEEQAKGNLRRVPEEHWQDLASRDLAEICERSLAQMHSPEGVSVNFLNMELLVDIENRRLRHMRHHHWHDVEQPLLELMTLVYLLNAEPDHPKEDLISVNELKDALFFQGAHDLPIVPLLSRFGNDVAGFKTASAGLAGEQVDYGDVAYRFHPFPKIPLYYLLWEGDEEFEPNMSILFDRTIERHLAADGILGMVNLVSNALLTFGKNGE